MITSDIPCDFMARMLFLSSKSATLGSATSLANKTFAQVKRVLG